MKSISRSSGKTNPISRAFRSSSFVFGSLVVVPKTTRCSIQSMYTAAQITPVPASIVTIDACCTANDVQAPSIIRNSPTKPFKNGKPIDDSDELTKNVDTQG